jgi:anti-sigma factor RsiW
MTSGGLGSERGTDGSAGPNSIGPNGIGPNHEAFQFDDAPYVLGALDDLDRAAFERHLGECPRCRESVAELGGLPDTLARADSSAWIPEQLPETLLPRLQREVRNHQRRRRVRWVATGAVAACAIALLTVLGTVVWGGDDSAKPQAMQAVSGAQIDDSASVRLTKIDSGTSVTVECDHYPPTAAGGYPAPAGGGSAATTYRLVVVNRAGATQWPASWPVGNDIKITTTSSWAPQNISKIVIEDDGGRPIFQLNR